MNTEETHDEIVKFFESECGLKADALDDDTSLFSTRLLDSLDLIDLITFLEKSYGIKVHPMEVGVEHLDSIRLIMDFVKEKTSQG